MEDIVAEIIEKAKASSQNKKKVKTKSKFSEQEHYMKELFKSLDLDNNGTVNKADLKKALSDAGIQNNDERISMLIEELNEHPSESLTFAEFKKFTNNYIAIIEKALRGDFIIPEFPNFCNEIEKIIKKTKKHQEGKVADYIPQLKRVEPEKYGVSICTIDGQTNSWGDAEEGFVVQSVCKPINYCLALEEHGEDYVHDHVGREPSGAEFNALTLNNDGLPHNPMINAGAIMCCSMIKPDLNSADRFDYVLNRWRDIAGCNNIQFNNSVYLSEKETADRNFALGYFMKEKGSFPDNTDLVETLKFYFQCCSIETNCETLSRIGATLANGGINPITGKRVLKSNTVKDCLSLMYSCGMYDFSGEFAFTMGIPSKSGVSGAMLVVIPNVLGIAIWSPRLDALGNSVRGLEFCKELIKKYNFHNYDNLATHCNKTDPRKHKMDYKLEGIVAACWACSHGDMDEFRKLIADGLDINDKDYDGRTPLHIAASEGHENIVKYLVAYKAKLNPIDRWGNTPLDNSISAKQKDVSKILKDAGAKKAKELKT